jgi:hypothetical protein
MVSYICCSFYLIESYILKRAFRKAVREEFSRMGGVVPEILTEQDITALPDIVQKYIRYAGFIGKEKVLNFRAEFRGGIRFKPGEEYMPLRSVQYNFMDVPARLFYIVARKAGVPAVGLHLYREARAIFRIKVLGLFTVVDAHGPKMDQGETVTVFNDMCFIAPGSLVDPKIRWEPLNELSVRAVYTNGDISVGAVLYFDAEGRLIDFLSHDRFETNGKEYVNNPWRTPVQGYSDLNGYRLPSKARLIYDRPEGEFCYGEFELASIRYNCREFE